MFEITNEAPPALSGVWRPVREPKRRLTSLVGEHELGGGQSLRLLRRIPLLMLNVYLTEPNVSIPALGGSFANSKERQRRVATAPFQPFRHRDEV